MNHFFQSLSLKSCLAKVGDTMGTTRGLLAAHTQQPLYKILRIYFSSVFILLYNLNKEAELLYRALQIELMIITTETLVKYLN